MWLTTRHEGFDGMRPTHRGAHMGSLIDTIVNGQLRMGLLLQFIAWTGLIASHYIFEGEGFFTWDLTHTTSRMRQNDNYRLTLLILVLTHLAGAIYLMAFQAALADDSAWARGYRAGSKFFQHAVLFDVVSSVMMVAGFLNLYCNYTEAFWSHFREGNLDWLFSAGSRVLHGLAWLLYANAFVLLEIYHDEGTNDWHGIVNWILYGLAGVAELSVLFLADSCVNVMLGWVGLLSALIWAMAFEQEVNETSPKMTESELCNELEKEIERYTRKTPWTVQKAGGPPLQDQVFEIEP